MYNETVKTPSKSNRNTNLTEVFHETFFIKLFFFVFFKKKKSEL